jgi:lysozyme
MEVIKHKQKSIVLPLLLLVCALLLILLLWFEGIIIPNAISAKLYSVKGVDVSSYQGEIEWDELQIQDIRFAFIKATEGSNFVDNYFVENWKEAEKTTLRIGAYHFFSFDSAGKTQAQKFIQTVPNTIQALPPVIDVEFYGDKEKNPPEHSKVQKELHSMVEMLEKHYGKGVILYTTKEVYELYIKNSFAQCDIWIRDVFTKPTLSDNRNWIFWQYTDRERLEGYSGDEMFIDVNVFYGDEEEFAEYGN